MTPLEYFYNFIAYSCIIPILNYLFNSKILQSKHKIIFIYLCICLIAEILMEFNRTYTFVNQIIIIYSFVYTEILLFILYSFKYLSKIFIIILSVIIICMLSSLIYALYINNDLINSTIGTQLGTGRLILSLISVHVLLKSAELKIQKSENTLLLAL